MTDETTVQVDRRGRLGCLTLNRPSALNALSLDMMLRLRDGLDRFADDDAVEAVALLGAGGRAFCAGGDVRSIYEHGRPEDRPRLVRRLFDAEYRLDYRINQFPKPVVAIMDGITMGGGCGLALNASHPIASGRTMIAMPETVLGLFPDVGAAWFLNRLPGEFPVYLALTGHRLTGPDAIAIGLVRASMDSANLPPLLNRLAAAPSLGDGQLDRIIDAFAGRPPYASDLPKRAQRIDALFAGDRVDAIVAALEQAPEVWAEAALATLKRASPFCLAVTLAWMRRGRGLPIEEIFRTDYRLALRLAARDDLGEGVRSVLIDKDQRPRWQPAQIADVDPAEVEACFAPLPAGDPEFDHSK